MTNPNYLLPLSEDEYRLLSGAIQSAFTSIETARDYIRNQEDGPITMHHALTQIETDVDHAYTSAGMLYSYVEELMALVRRLADQRETTLTAYSRGWADRLMDILSRLSAQDRATLLRLLEDKGNPNA